MNNVMIDLETLDTKETSVVLSIGAVKFDETGLGETIHMTLKIQPQLDMGRTISGSTIEWWLNQTSEAKQAAFAQDLSVESALKSLDEFILGDDVSVWGNGAMFDNAILTHMYNSAHMARPWSYKGDRCYRTVRALTKQLHPQADVDVSHGEAHNALDDAIAQALSLQKMLAVLRTKADVHA